MKNSTRQKLRKQIREDVNPEALVAAVKRKDKSYLRGAIQWYERQSGKTCLTDFLKKVYAEC